MSTKLGRGDAGSGEFQTKQQKHPLRLANVPIVLAFLMLVTAAVASLSATEHQSTIATSSQQSGKAAGQPQNGKAAYEQSGCNQCHGTQGEGVSGAGTNAGVPRIASTNLSLADFLQQVRKPKGQMPPFSNEKVSDAELNDVYAYLQSLKPMAEQPVTTMSTSKGERLYNDYGCYECHGLQGQGSASTGGARLGPPRIPLSAFVSYIRQPAGEMPPYTAKVLSDVDASNIYDFLKSVPPPPPLKNISLLNQ